MRESLIVALFVCLILALVTKYLSIPAIPFYILAGVLLGKAGGGLLTNNDVRQFFSGMGLIFLLFFMGLGRSKMYSWVSSSGSPWISRAVPTDL